MNYETANKGDSTLKNLKKIRQSHEHKQWVTMVYMNEFPYDGRVKVKKLQK
jgi:tryptophan synthase alpha subunit